MLFFHHVRACSERREARLRVASSVAAGADAVGFGLAWLGSAWLGWARQIHPGYIADAGFFFFFSSVEKMFQDVFFASDTGWNNVLARWSCRGRGPGGCVEGRLVGCLDMLLSGGQFVALTFVFLPEQ